MRRKHIITLILTLFLTTTLLMNWQTVDGFVHPTTAYAVGDLTVDWGVPATSPIFTITHFAPGNTISHSVKVHNGATSSRPVGVRGIKVSESGNLGDALQITIAQNGIPVYGGTSSTGKKTLTQFFTETQLPNFAPLSVVPQNTDTTYSFTVSFDPTSGNSFQGKSITFNLDMGIAFTIPAACTALTITHDPIFGTQGNDRLFGKAGNNIIISFDGNDTIYGGSGKNCIIAGNGNNIIYGGAGKNVIIAGNGTNRVFDGASGDTVTLGTGRNYVTGGAGNDTIITNGLSTIDGGAGRNTCKGTTLRNCQIVVQ